MSAAVTLEAIKARCAVDGECWIWTGAKNHGKPCIAVSIDGKRVNLPAQKQAMEAAGKASPWGGPIKSRCANDQCCNPAHLIQTRHASALRFAGNPYAQLLQGGRA